MKRVAITIVSIVAFLAIVVAAIPFIVPGDFLKARIAAQVSSWTGRPVEIAGDPALSLYPSVTVTVDGLTIGNPEGVSGDAFVTVETVRATLEILPLLVGQTVFEQFEVIAPRVRLIIDKDGQPNWGMAKSRIARVAQRTTEARATPPDGTATVTPAASAPPPDVRIGNLRVTGGTIIFDDLRSERREELTGLSLDVAWPRASSSGRAAGSLQWRGETVAFNGSVTDPLSLIGGESSAVRFAIASTALRVTFTGTANRNAGLLEGRATATTPSLRRTVGWLGMPLGVGPILGAASIDGAVTVSANGTSFAGAALELDGNVATGDVLVNVSGPRPVVTAALKTSRLDLTSYLEAARADLVAEGSWLIAPTRLTFAEALDTELRIDATEVLVGATRIGKLAAVATTRNGVLDVRIGEAQLYGGTLTATAAARMVDTDLVANANAAIADVPAGVALADAFGITALDGRATTTIALGSRGASWGAFARGISGTANIAVANGTFTGFEIPEVAALMADPEVAPIQPDGDSTAFQRLTGTLAISQGDLATDDLRMEGNGFSVAIAGRGSVLNGIVDAKARIITGTGIVPLTITGRWRTPTVARAVDGGTSTELAPAPAPVAPTGG